MDLPTDRSSSGDGAPAPADPDRPVGFEHLGWTPTWRDRLDVVVGRLAAGRVAAVAVGAVVVVVVAIVLLRGAPPPPPELTIPMAGGSGDPGASATTSTSLSVVETTAQPGEVVVHAAGSVTRPGVYRFAAGARVAELLDAAGGAAPAADLDRLNLAAPLVDGDRVYVPTIGGEVPAVVGGGVPAPPGPAGETGGGPIDINTATVEELETLPGVGPATAQAILDERGRRGRFAAVDDLLDVRGIGEAKLAAIRDRVRV